MKKKIFLCFKRLFDIVASSIALVILAIPMLIVVILIKIDDKDCVIFKQLRMRKKFKTVLHI